MLPFEDRYTRQRQLPEVGLAGQERLARAWARVPPQGLAREVAELYLRGAGVMQFEVAAGASLDEFPHARYFRHAAARDAALGAHAALTTVRGCLGMAAALTPGHDSPRHGETP